jgi:hypothetical protein
MIQGNHGILVLMFNQVWEVLFTNWVRDIPHTDYSLPLGEDFHKMYFVSTISDDWHLLVSNNSPGYHYSACRMIFNFRRHQYGWN